MLIQRLYKPVCHIVLAVTAACLLLAGLTGKWTMVNSPHTYHHHLHHSVSLRNYQNEEAPHHSVLRNYQNEEALHHSVFRNYQNEEAPHHSVHHRTLSAAWKADESESHSNGSLVDYDVLEMLESGKDTEKPSRDDNDIKRGKHLSNTNDSLSWEQEQEARRHIMDVTCSKLTNHISLSEAGNMHLFQDSIVVDRRHRSVYCAIPKAACSSWRSALAVLTDKVNASGSFSVNSLDVHNLAFMSSIGIKRLTSYPLYVQESILKSFKKFVVVRHPFERLVSAFRDKFQTYNKYTRHFQYKYGRYIIKNYRHNPLKKSLLTGFDVTFPEFIHWILDPYVDEDFKFNAHWARYQDLCHPCLVKYDYIVNYDTFDKDTGEILNRLFNVKESEKFFPKRNVKKTHSRDIEAEYLEQLSDTELASLYDIYKTDFEMFGYKFHQ